MRLGLRQGQAVGLTLLVLAWLAVPVAVSTWQIPVPAPHAAALALHILRSASADPPLVTPLQAPSLERGARRAVVRVTVGRSHREFVDVSPAAYSGPLPLIVVLHGRRQTPWRAERAQHWDVLAARGEAVIAYGAGYAGSWNAGTCCKPATRAGIDDVGYVRTVLRTEEHRHPVDPRRVYLVGFSNGGMLAYRFACAHANLLSALVVVDGSLQVHGCRPARALNVLAVQGGRDRVVPYGGSRYSIVAGAATTSIPDSLRPWQQLAGAGAVVHLVRLPHLGHEWPTRRRGGWDGTTQIWRFLTLHGRSAAP